MRLNRIVIHNLITESGQRDVVLQPSEALLPVDDRSVQVAEQLSASYRNREISYATFTQEEGKAFPRAFRSLAGDLTDAAFLRFSQETSSDLKAIVENVTQARGGYLVFMDYNQDAHHFLGIFLVRNTEGVIFRRDDASRIFLIDPSVHIDIDKLAMAGRINIQRFVAEPTANYISFIKHAAREVSDYFVRWLAATQLENSKHYTELLYKMTAAIRCPSNEEDQELPRDEFRKQIHDYVQTQPNKTVNLQTMSEHFYDDPQFIPSFLEQQNLQIDTEFKVHSGTMKKFVRVDVKADGIEMKFSRGDAHTKVRVENDSLVVIESQPFASRMRSVLDET